MSLLFGFLAQILHAAACIAAAPLLLGVIGTLKARLQGRIGPPLLQPWRDLIRLARKQPVVAENASPLFRAAPFVTFTTTMAAALLVPSFAVGMISGPLADLLAIAGLLGLGRCTLALAGMDIGTAFGGIGASREMMFATFAEPAVMLIILTLALLAGTTNLDAVAALQAEGSLGVRVSLGLALIAMIIVALTENGRIPVDNPATHLELTMVHEAMILEYSGRDLALIEGSTALRLLLWFNLIIAVFLPFGAAQFEGGVLQWLFAVPVWIAKLLAMAGALAVFETMSAKLRVFRVPDLLGVAVLLGLLAAVFLFVSQGFV